MLNAFEATEKKIDFNAITVRYLGEEQNLGALIRQKADLNLLSECSGSTALTAAVSREKFAVVEALLLAGADPWQPMFATRKSSRSCLRSELYQTLKISMASQQEG